MATAINPGWSKPAAILFACEVTVNEKAFSFALAEAAEFGAELILFHAFHTPYDAEPENSDLLHYSMSAARAHKRTFEPLVERARSLGVHCKIVVSPGLAAEQILLLLRERKFDRVVMGTHSPGPVGKLLVGSVAEQVLRNSNVPVSIVGSEVIEGAYRHCATRTILCAVGDNGSGPVVVSFAAELAARQKASLILQHVIPPQNADEFLAGRTLDQIEAELPALMPQRLQHKIQVRTRVVLGDPTEELLYQGRALHASLIVMGAQGASHFAAVSRAGIVYKVLAFSQCPVLTLSPVVLAECGASQEQPRSSELCMAGVF